jgi:hypothetical protein
MTKSTTIAIAAAALLTGAAQAGSTASTGKAGVGAPPAAASANPFTGSVTLGYDTDYVYRGYQVLSSTGEKARHLLWGAVDFNLALSDSLTWNVNLWYADSAKADYSEFDAYTRLAFKVSDALTIGPSFKYYNYPDYPSAVGDQYEFGLEANITPFANAAIYLGGFYELEAEQFYFELGANYTVKLCSNFSLVPGASVSFIDVDSQTFGLSDSGFNHVAAYLRAPITFGKATITPYVQGNFPIGDQIDAGQDNLLFGGVSVSLAF